MTEHLSFCRICAAACGIRVDVEGDQVIRVRGDADHPASRGYVCGKGRGLAEWHHHPDRLNEPRLAGVEVGWDEALADLAATITTVVAESGPDSIALYLATGLAYDSAGQIATTTWHRSMGSAAFYTAATVDNAPVLVAARMVAGNPSLNPVWDPHSPGVLLSVGTNPVVSHGYGTTLPDPVRHLRDYRGRGGQVWVLDPRRTETAAHADEHLALRPGSDVAVLAAVAAALLAEGADGAELSEHCHPHQIDALRSALAPFSAERAAAAADVDADRIEQLIAVVRANPGRLAVFCGTGTTMSRDGLLVEWLRWVLLILTGSLDRPGGMRFHDGLFPRPGPARPPRPDGGGPRPGPASRPELRRVAGQVPAVALADEIDAGNVRVLVVTGGNPLTALPDPDRLRAVLPKLDALVMVDVVDSELTTLATHVLPATGQLERADVTLSSQLSVRSAIQSTAAVVTPVAGRKPVWWIFSTLARRMGLDLLDGSDPDELDDTGYLRLVMAMSALDTDGVLDAGPSGVEVPVEVGWVRDLLVDRRWNIGPDVLLDRLAAYQPPTDGLVLTPRRNGVWNNSVRYSRSGDERLVRIHPADADAAGVIDGDSAEITTAHGALAVVIGVDPSVRPGVVSMSHGRPDASPGRLTSSTDGVDPLTGMPHASGVEVTLRGR